ncbi:hypothetical protein FGB62_188g03 [Gracilaria domingensis]|nr:hypothetical protein FGB62_188g03 [Gracilaria domingensis]
MERARSGAVYQWRLEKQQSRHRSLCNVRTDGEKALARSVVWWKNGDLKEKRAPRAATTVNLPKIEMEPGGVSAGVADADLAAQSSKETARKPPKAEQAEGKIEVERAQKKRVAEASDGGLVTKTERRRASGKRHEMEAKRQTMKVVGQAAENERQKPTDEGRATTDVKLRLCDDTRKREWSGSERGRRRGSPGGTKCAKGEETTN